MIEELASQCASCRTLVVDAVNARSGARQPFDAAPAPDGAFAIRAGHAGLVAEPLTVAQRFGRPALYRPHPVPCRRRPPALPPHEFTRDQLVPEDPHDGALVCLCGKRGRPGDPQHPDGAPPLAAGHPLTPPAAREIEARMFGEPE